MRYMLQHNLYIKISAMVFRWPKLPIQDNGNFRRVLVKCGLVCKCASMECVNKLGAYVMFSQYYDACHFDWNIVSVNCVSDGVA